MFRSHTRAPMGLLQPVGPSRDHPAGVMRSTRGKGYCEGCRLEKPAPPNRAKGWRCADCTAGPAFTVEDELDRLLAIGWGGPGIRPNVLTIDGVQVYPPEHESTA